LEETIRREPANYLWTHRRWRHEFTPQFEELWMDNRPKP